VGITTPAQLAMLELQDYDLVGVTDTAERKKLFFLIERVKIVRPCRMSWCGIQSITLLSDA
jgi:hypothetical protein